MKRSPRMHNRMPSHFAFRKPYEFAAISIRWSKTFTYLQNARSHSTSTNTITTPNFGTIPTPIVGGPETHQHDLSNVSMETVSDITIAQLRGPWLVLFPDNSLQLPAGELMIEANGIVFFRPGKDLGYGVGRIDLASDGNFSINLETYLYEQTSKFPPNASTHWHFRGIVQRAVIGAHNAAIFTFNGRVARRGEDATEQFQAAKMDGWSEEAHQAARYVPDRAVAESLERVIPPMASFPPRPFLDLEKYKVGDIPNIYYIPNWVSADEEQTMLRILKSTPKDLKQQLDRRKVQEYGGSMCATCNTSFVAEANLPTWCSQVCGGLTEAGVFTPATFPNNVRIHEYETKEGIAPHVDGPIYVPIVAILSLASPCVMSFYPRREPYENPMDHYNDTFKFDGEIAKQTPVCSLVLEPRSLLVFSHDVYWYHPHGIRAEAADSLSQSECGPIVNRHLMQNPANSAQQSLPRQYRVGVTIRNLLPRCNHQPARAEHFMGEAFTKLHKMPAAVDVEKEMPKLPEKPKLSEKPKVPIAPEPPVFDDAGENGPLGLPQMRPEVVAECERYEKELANKEAAKLKEKEESATVVPPPAQMPTAPPIARVEMAGPQPTQYQYPPQVPVQMAPPQPVAHWAYPYAPHVPFPAYYPPPMPVYPPQQAQAMHPHYPPQQAAQPQTSPADTKASEKFDAISAKLNGLMQKIESMEKSVTQLEANAKAPADDSGTPTMQILTGLVQSHLKLKEDHGEILDRVCKAVVETNLLVKNMPKKE